MWNGAFFKHRDFQHADYLEHELANGGKVEVQSEWVMCDTEPIEESPLTPSDRYYAVDLTTHENKWYRYLVRAELDGSKPNMDNIAESIEGYSRNPVSGGRDWLDYVDTEETPSGNLAALFASQQSVPQWRERLRVEYFYPLESEEAG